MTQEEKAKAYDKAIKKLQEALSPTADGCEISGLTRRCVEEIFPELKESEDDRIRKTLIEYFNAYPKDYYGELKKSHIIAWLEKQESVEEIVERCKTSWYNEGKIDGMAEGLTDDEKYQQGWHDALEKQGEQKPQRIISAEAKEALYDKLAWSEEYNEKL